jgi:hypothetical protein
MTFNYTVVSLVLILLTSLAVDVPTGSQQTKPQPLGKLSGLILDPGNARVPKAKIIVEREGFRREAISAADGSYEIELPVNSYAVIAIRDSFHPTREADIQVRTDKITNLDLVIKGIHVEENLLHREEEVSTETVVPNNSVELRRLKPKQ